MNSYVNVEEHFDETDLLRSPISLSGSECDTILPVDDSLDTSHSNFLFYLSPESVKEIKQKFSNSEDTHSTSLPVSLSLDNMPLTLPQTETNCDLELISFDPEIVDKLINADMSDECQSFDGFSDISSFSFEGFDGSSPLGLPLKSRSRNSESFNSSVEMFKFGDLEEIFCSDSEEEEFEGFALKGKKSSRDSGPNLGAESSRQVNAEESIGEYCDKVNCSISWLESGEAMNPPVPICNGIVFELSEFSKKIAWEPEFLAKWILRLRGYKDVDASAEDVQKIHFLMKRRKALTVTFAGNPRLKVKLTAFDLGEFSLPTAEKLDGMRDTRKLEPLSPTVRKVPPPKVNKRAKSVIPFSKAFEEGRGILKTDSTRDGNMAGGSQHVSMRDANMEHLSQNVSKGDADSYHFSKCVSPRVDIKHAKSISPLKATQTDFDPVSQIFDADNPQSLPTTSDQITRSSSQDSEGPETDKSEAPKFNQPIFTVGNNFIGNHCFGSGIDINLINSDKKSNALITNGIVYELYHFFRNQGATLTSLVHTIYRLKGKKMDKSLIISTMAKIHELVKILWEASLTKNPDMPYLEFETPSSPTPTQEYTMSYKPLPYDPGRASKVVLPIESCKRFGFGSAVSINNESFSLRETKMHKTPLSKSLEKEPLQEGEPPKQGTPVVHESSKERDLAVTSTSPTEAEKSDDSLSHMSDEETLGSVQSSTPPQLTSSPIASGFEAEKEEKSSEIQIVMPHSIFESIEDSDSSKVKVETPADDAFDFNLTMGSQGRITKGDIVFLYSRWLKRKIDKKASVFVTDLSADVVNLFKARSISNMRIPVGKLISSSVDLFKEFTQCSNKNPSKARELLLQDWCKYIQTYKIAKPKRRSMVNSPSTEENDWSKKKGQRSKDAAECEVINLDIEDERLNKEKLKAFSLAKEVQERIIKGSNLSKREIKKPLKLSYNNPLRKQSASIDNYDVEKIVGYRIVKMKDKSITEYKVRWLGFPSSRDSWVEENDLNCPLVLKTFWDALLRQKEKNKLKNAAEAPNNEIPSEDADKLLKRKSSSEEASPNKFVKSSFLNDAGDHAPCREQENLPPREDYEFFGRDNSLPKKFFRAFRDNLNLALVNYVSGQERLSLRKGKVSKGEVLSIYDSWRQRNMECLWAGGNQTANVNELVSDVKALMEERKVRNFTGRSLLDVCYRMSLTRSKLSDPQEIDEYLSGDFMELVKASSIHQQFILDENQTKLSTRVKETTDSEVGFSDKTESCQKQIDTINTLEKEVLGIALLLDKNKYNKIFKTDLEVGLESLQASSQSISTDVAILKKLKPSQIKSFKSLGLSENTMISIISSSSKMT